MLLLGNAVPVVESGADASATEGELMISGGGLVSNTEADILSGML